MRQAELITTRRNQPQYAKKAKHRQFVGSWALASKRFSVCEQFDKYSVCNGIRFRLLCPKPTFFASELRFTDSQGGLHQLSK